MIEPNRQIGKRERKCAGHLPQIDRLAVSQRQKCAASIWGSPEVESEPNWNCLRLAAVPGRQGGKVSAVLREGGAFLARVPSASLPDLNSASVRHWGHRAAGPLAWTLHPGGFLIGA